MIEGDWLGIALSLGIDDVVGTVDGESDRSDGCDDKEGDPDGCIDVEGTDDGATLGSSEGKVEGDWLGIALIDGIDDVVGTVDGESD